ncbi:MAG: GerMN domain-containing protein [Lysinibacillus sp.]
MKDEKWSEQQLEELLSQAPKMQDCRSKEDVFARLKEAGAFEEEPVQRLAGKKRRPSMLFGLVAALTFLTFGGVYYFSQDAQEDASMSMNDMESADKQEFEMESADKQEAKTESFGDEEISETSIQRTVEEDIRTSVYEEQLEEATAFHIGLAGDDAESIPVTIVVPNEKLLKDFGIDVPTQVDMYNKYAAKIDEQAAGFSEFHPVKGTIEERGNAVVHTLPDNHGYDESAGTAAVYTGMLTDTFGKSYDKAVVQNEDGTPIVFEKIGTPSEPIDLKDSARYSYFLDEQRGGTFLAPNFRQTFQTVTEALEYMKVEDNDIYKTAILPGVDYTVTDGDIVKVNFTAPLDLEAVDSRMAMYMIEAMLLTASGFGKQILFGNIVQTEWHGFHFAEPLPKPVGANEIPLETIRNN